MSGSASPDGRRPFSRAYFLLGAVTAFATFALTVLGTAVRVSKSTVGCGAGDIGYQAWPLCDGRIDPLVGDGTAIEYAAGALSVAIIAGIGVLLVVGLWRYRAERNVIRALWAALVGAGVQAVLAGVSVETGVTEGVVTAGLVVAMIMLGLLYYVARATARRASDPALSGEGSVGRLTRWLVTGAAVIAFACLATGGYVSATEQYGLPQHAQVAGAHAACGGSFPYCNGELLPFGRFGRIADAHLVHRALAGAAAALVLLVLVASFLRRRNRELVLGAALATTAAMMAEVLLGALTVWLGGVPWLVTAHLAVGAVLWILCVDLFLRTRPARHDMIVIRRSPSREREAETVAA